VAIEDSNKEPKGRDSMESQPGKKNGESIPVAPPASSPPKTSTTKDCQRGDYEEMNYGLRKKQFLVAKITLLVLAAYTVAAFYQACKMRKAADAAKASADAAESAANIAQQQLEMSERPWLVTEYTPSAPLKFTADGGATFGVEGKVANIGHSVALDVHDNPLITIQEVGVEMMHPTVKQKEVCDQIRDTREKLPNFADGDTLFPGQFSLENMPLNFSRDDIEKARIPKTDTIWGLVIIGCVDYKFSFSPKHHQTAYVYEIVRPAPGRVGSLSIKIGENLQPNQLIIRRSIFGGFYAD
jgi:hypothetical protein